ncbi:hypothetical protein [Nodularia harveyana]|nr:hypothetical protein [Nodularia harveyana]
MCQSIFFHQNFRIGEASGFKHGGQARVNLFTITLSGWERLQK